MIPALRRPWPLDDRGTTSLEFALVAPLLFTFIFGLFEIYFALFNFEQVQAVASATARCMAIASPLCAGTNGGAAYAVNMAAPGHGVDKLTQQMVTVNTSATCEGQAGMVRVVITYPIGNAMPVNFIPSFTNLTLTGVGCFPDIAATG